MWLRVVGASRRVPYFFRVLMTLCKDIPSFSFASLYFFYIIHLKAWFWFTIMTTVGTFQFQLQLGYE